ncbi:calpain-5, partial [Elysia marginata]
MEVQENNTEGESNTEPHCDTENDVQDLHSQTPQAFERPQEVKEDLSLIGSPGPHGLVIGQGYNVTMVRSVEVKKSLQAAVGAATLQLVRLYNPWQGKEYTGPWSDTSKEWKSIAASEWAKMGIKFEKEGEFWMCFSDWVKYFTDTDICHFVNTSFFTLKKTWTETICLSEWSSAGRNGGNNWDSLSFLSNPQVEVNRQYRVHVKGAQVFKSQFLNSRNVFGTCTLPKARYVIIPCCANANAAGQFMLRLYTSNKTAG